MVQQPKTVLLPVELQCSFGIRRVFSPRPGPPAAAAAGQDCVLGRKSASLLDLALEKLVVQGDKLVVLLIQPPPNALGAAQLQECEAEMRRSLEGQLHTCIQLASAKHIRVEVLVGLRSDRRQAILRYALALEAAIMVVSKPEPRGANILRLSRSHGSTHANEESGPEDLAKELPCTCQVMVVDLGRVVESLAGQIATPLPRPGPAVARGLRAEVLREIYGEVEFSMAEVRAATQDFSNVIGRGGSAMVYRGRLRNRDVAVKRLLWWTQTANMAPAMARNRNFQQFLNELRVMRQASDQNLLELLGLCVTESELLLVFDFQPHGSLDHRLQQEPLLTWQQRLEIAAGAARGLQYLHSCQPAIIHRDVKSANILLDQSSRDRTFTAKVSDFGLAKVEPEGDVSEPFSVSVIMGTRGYLAPEHITTGQITKAIDVYAFGVVLLELVTGQLPLDHDRTPPCLSDYAKAPAWRGDPRGLLDRRLTLGMNDSAYAQIRPQLEPVFWMAMLCLERTPENRPSMKEVAHWLNEILHRRF